MRYRATYHFYAACPVDRYFCSLFVCIASQAETYLTRTIFTSWKEENFSAKHKNLFALTIELALTTCIKRKPEFCPFSRRGGAIMAVQMSVHRWKFYLTKKKPSLPSARFSKRTSSLGRCWTKEVARCAPDSVVAFQTHIKSRFRWFAVQRLYVSVIAGD